MLSVLLILLAVVTLAASGVAGCLLPSDRPLGQRIAVTLMVAGGVMGLAGVLLASGESATPGLRFPWAIPGGEFSVAVDSISCFFLVPVFLVPVMGSIYGLGYWRQSEHSANGARLGLAYGLLAASMALIVISRDGVLFLVSWELMALSTYFVATVEDHDSEVRRAGWIYIVSTHVGTLSLLAMFALWRSSTGSFDLSVAQTLSSERAGLLFLLAVLGFGLKAGLMPLHIWLPGAHANAPSHVSAVMSAVVTKMGVYGLVRMSSLLPTMGDWWGGAVLALGAVSGIFGIAFAIGQHDLKRLLAYSSIENIGIIVMGLGLALIGRAHGQWHWVVLGLGGALLHVWNHSLFKSLLFLNAGALIHAAHTRDMNLMGGLARRMPQVAALFLVGAIAISALPPLNGFVSELFLYIGLFGTLGVRGAVSQPFAALGAVALAMIGALAVACFVKLLGSVFLGMPRGAVGEHVHDTPPSMLIPMRVLALGCVCVGLVPMAVIPAVDGAVGSWVTLLGPRPSLASLVPLHWVTLMGVGLVLVFAALVWALGRLPRAKVVATAGTWDCGYALPTQRMQYTGSSFASSLVTLFSFALLPKSLPPALRGRLFARETEFRSTLPDAVLDRILLPCFRAMGQHLPRFRVLQRGQTQVYLVYILVAVIFLLVCGAIGVQP